jgi:peptide/nickel transport system substrate-binding protein
MALDHNHRATSRPVSRRRLLTGTIAGTAGFVALAALGCGGSDNKQSSSATTPSASAQPAAKTPKDGSYYRQAITTWPNNPDLHREVNGSLADHQIFSNLVIFSDVNSGTMEGDAAAKLPEQPDQVTYVFTLKPGITWHNKPPANGTELTIEQVKWNFERQMARKLANGMVDPSFQRYTSVYQFIDRVETPDTRTIRVTLKKPNAPWLSAMGDQLNGLMYPDVALAIETKPGVFDAAQILGTGPYYVKEYQQNRNMRLERQPNYFRKKAGEPVQFLDTIVGIDIGTDVNAIRAAFEQKQIDWLGGSASLYSKEFMDAVTSANKGVDVVKSADPNNNQVLLYNISKGPFSNLKIRQAFQLAIDRSQILQQVFSGEGRLNGPIPWPYGDWALPQAELATLPGFRQDKTQDLKDARAFWEAGGGPGLGDITVAFVQNAFGQAAAEWFPAMLNKNLGISQVKPIFIQAGASQFNYLIGPDYVSNLAGFGSWTQPDPRATFANRFGKDGGLNFGKYNNPQMEALIAKSFETFDKNEAFKVMQDAQRAAMQDAGAGFFSMCGGLITFLKWPYLQRTFSNFGNYWDKNVSFSAWIDQGDASFRGRPALPS